MREKTFSLFTKPLSWLCISFDEGLLYFYKAVVRLEDIRKSGVVCLFVLYIFLFSASYYILQDDGHVIKDTYMVLSNPKEKNRLTITKLDLTNNYIEAEFDATFLLKLRDDGMKWFADSPDTLRFRGVKFKASIVNLQ